MRIEDGISTQKLVGIRARTALLAGGVPDILASPIHKGAFLISVLFLLCTTLYTVKGIEIQHQAKSVHLSFYLVFPPMKLGKLKRLIIIM
jgi:hypothetical protein